MEIKNLERKKVSETVPVQSIIPRPLYVQLVTYCAKGDFTIKALLKSLIQDFVKHEQLFNREWEITDEQWNKAFTAYEVYTAIRDRDDLQEKEKVKKHE